MASIVGRVDVGNLPRKAGWEDYGKIEIAAGMVWLFGLAVWCEFKRNAAKQTLSIGQVAAAPALAAEAVNALRDQEFIDPAILATLEQLADVLRVPESEDNPTLNVIEAGKNLLAADLIESVNNVLKRIAEFALTASQRAESIADNVAKEYVDRFEKSAIAEAGRLADKDGGRVVRWLRRLAIAGAVGGFASLSGLISKFPDAFQWLTHALQFFE